VNHILRHACWLSSLVTRFRAPILLLLVAVGSLATAAIPIAASGSFYSNHPYLRDNNYNKAYSGVHFAWGSWQAPCCGGSYYTLPLYWIENYANIFVTSYSFSDWYQEAWGVGPGASQFGHQTINYWNTPDYNHRDFYQGIGSTYANISVLGVWCSNASWCSGSTFTYGVYKIGMIQYHNDTAWFNSWGIGTTYP
jgi:hypothetical protein